MPTQAPAPTNEEIIEALHILSTIPVSSPSLAFLAREFNLFSQVLREQGLRTMFTATDLSLMFARMLDIAQVKPLSLPTADPGQHAHEHLDESKPIPIDLDNIESSARGPATLKLFSGGKSLKEPST